MSTNTADPDDRFPTTGPSQDPYDAYRSVTTTDDRGLIYHVDRAEQWIESDAMVTLDAWRQFVSSLSI